MFYGRRLLGDLVAHGLTEVEAEGRVLVARGGSAIGRVDRLALEQVRERFIAGGHMTAGEVDELCALYDALASLRLGHTVIAVRGCRPRA